MQHPPAKFRPVFLLIFLSTWFTAAWQNTPPLSLTAVAEPVTAAPGQMVTFTLAIANVGDVSLEDVEITATAPQGTDFDRATADNEQWDIDLAEGVVHYRATGPFPGGERAQVRFVVAVLPGAAPSITFDTYQVTAKGLAAPIKGTPVTIQVVATPQVTATPSAPAPTPTITVVAAELPPTPTPNLSSEQEVVGTITVLIFVVIALAIIIAAVVWIVRTARSG